MDMQASERSEETFVADPGPRKRFRRSRSALPFMNMLNGRSGDRIVMRRCMALPDGWRFAGRSTTATRRVDRHAEVRRFY